MICQWKFIIDLHNPLSEKYMLKFVMCRWLDNAEYQRHGTELQGIWEYTCTQFENIRNECSKENGTVYSKIYRNRLYI